MTAVVNTGSFSDAGGNVNASASNILSYTVDFTIPTVTLSGSTSQTLSGTSVTAVTVVLSETSTNFASGDVTVTNGTLSNFASSGTGYTFDVTATGATPMTAVVNTGSFSDAGGNVNASASNILSYTVDFTAPVVVLS